MRTDRRFKVTGVLTNGRRFKAIHTNNIIHATSINLYRGTVWEHDGERWRVMRRVWN